MFIVNKGRPTQPSVFQRRGAGNQPKNRTTSGRRAAEKQNGDNGVLAINMAPLRGLRSLGLSFDAVVLRVLSQFS
jgi:hypothetical protein